MSLSRLTHEEDFIPAKNEIISDIKRLGLQINKDKIECCLLSQPFSYLGYSFSNKYITVRNSSVLRIENSIEELVRELRNNHRYLEWKLNLKVTGFIIDDNKYGWMFFYSQITETSVLHHLDWVVNKILERYNVQSKIRPKRFVRTYFEIVRNLHETTYILNLNNYTIDDKKRVLIDIYEQPMEEFDEMDDADIERLFRRIMKKEIRDIEKDIEHFS